MKIAVIGLGYVGLPLAIQFARSNVNVIGLDVDKTKVDDERESPSYILMDLLSDRRAQLDYYDPYVPVIKPTREHSHWAGIKSVKWDRATIEGFDLVLIATNH